MATGWVHQPSGGGGKDVFVHFSAVEYEIESNRAKESAVNLKITSPFCRRNRPRSPFRNVTLVVRAARCRRSGRGSH
jgi:hypothetical protein